MTRFNKPPGLTDSPEGNASVKMSPRGSKYARNVSQTGCCELLFICNDFMWQRRMNYGFSFCFFPWDLLWPGAAKSCVFPIFQFPCVSSYLSSTLFHRDISCFLQLNSLKKKTSLIIRSSTNKWFPHWTPLKVLLKIYDTKFCKQLLHTEGNVFFSSIHPSLPPTSNFGTAVTFNCSISNYKTRIYTEFA